MSRTERYAEMARAATSLAKAQAASERASERSAAAIGTTRARKTTASARWSIAAEERDRKAQAFAKALEAAGFGPEPSGDEEWNLWREVACDELRRLNLLALDVASLAAELQGQPTHAACAERLGRALARTGETP